MLGWWWRLRRGPSVATNYAVLGIRQLSFSVRVRIKMRWNYADFRRMFGAIPTPPEARD